MRVSKSARHPIGDIEQWNWLDHFVVSVGHRCQPDRKPARRAGTAALAGSRHRRSGVYGC